ncbi:MAG: hypothetical protein ACLPLZ_00450 [Terracidiphilus sp.]
MFALDSFNLKKSWPLLIALLLVAQVDLACSFGWPQTLLSLLHLTAASDDLCRGVCAGIGTSIDVLVAFQLVRIYAKRAIERRSDPAHD